MQPFPVCRPSIRQRPSKNGLSGPAAEVNGSRAPRAPHEVNSEFDQQMGFAFLIPPHLVT